MHGDSDSTDINPGGADMASPPPPPPPPPAAPAHRRRIIGNRTATAAIAGGLVVGGIAGGYVISQAATSSPSASASPSAGSGSPTFPHGYAGAGPAASTQDLQQAATAIGITSAQLQTELTAGKTIAAIATEHNVAAATVISTLVTDENAEVDAALKSGQITQAQATQMKTQTTQRVTDFVNGTEPAHGPGGPGGPGRGLNTEDEAVVAGAIGITSAQLQTELTAGKTVAAIATEHNSSAATVISAWVASENTEIDQRVSSGQITAAEGAQMKTQTTQRVTGEVNGTRPAGGGPHGGWGGPPPGAASGTGTAPSN
jgi:fructose/tagatose bisphosphate aldolase